MDVASVNPELKPLTAKQELLVEAWAGNIAEAATAAGLRPDYARKAMLLPHVKAAIQKRKEKIQGKYILNRAERFQFWSKLIDDEGAADRDRLKASELLAKANGDFIEARPEVTRIEIVIPGLEALKQPPIDITPKITKQLSDCND